jgi:putative tricarboxylic transport membrane protein
MITFEHPKFIIQCAAILLLASMTMWLQGMTLARQFVKVLRIPAPFFMPIVGLLCIIGSYSLGLDMTNLYLMLPVGIISYFLIEMGYPIAPLVIGVILGPMADENLRRALMVSQGTFWPVFTRPVSLALFLIIVWLVLVQIPAVKDLKNRLVSKMFRKRRHFV